MFDAHALSDFVRDAPRHLSRLKASKAPEVLTVEGRAAVVVQDAEAYQEMVDELERARLVESLIEAERHYEAGLSRPAREAFAEMKARYGGV